MKTRRSKRLNYHLSILLLVLSVIALGLWAEQTSAQTAKLVASQDAFVDLNNPKDTYDQQRLEVTYSHFLDSFVPTRWALLQFDLAGLKGEAVGAQVVMEIVENNLPAGAEVDLALYGVLDSWAKNRVTYDTRPGGEVLLQTITLTAGSTGRVQFGDTEGGHLVGTYLEAERAGDGRASFLLRFEGGAGELGFAGNVLFEDREGSADGVNGNEPFIELRQSDGGAAPSEQLFLPLILKEAP